MKYKKKWVTVLVMIVCILVNLGGKKLAEVLELPIWLDSFGTVIAAYAYGPLCGAIAGLTMNIVSNISAPAYMVYGLTSVLIGVMVGYFARKKLFENMFGLLTTGFLVAIGSVIVSTPLNVLFFHGYTGNKWGDGVIDLMLDRNLNHAVCYMIGEYYVDFIDKVLTLLTLFAAVRLIRLIRKNRDGNAGKKAALFVAAGVAISSFAHPAQPVKAAENADYNAWLQTVYNAQSGLPGGVATDIVQTDDGVLWIGIYGGLYRYSGSEFRWMNEIESIKNVNCFFKDRGGRLWIGTNDNGLSVYHGGEIIHVLDEADGLPSNAVRCIAAGADGYYYVGTTSYMAIVKRAGSLSVYAVVPEITYATSISVNHNECAAVVSDGGRLFILDREKILLKKELGAQGESYNCCMFGGDGDLYVGTTANRIIRYEYTDGKLKEKKIYSCGDLYGLNALNFADNGCLMICAMNGAGYLDTGGAFHKLNTNQFNSCIDRVIFDYQGNMWFTSSRQGLLKLSETPFTELYSKLELDGTVVNTVVKWQNRFYFGTDSGLDMADGGLTRKMEDTLTQSLAGIRIRCLMTDNDGALWICTSSAGAWRVLPGGRVNVYDSAAGAMGDKFRSALQMSDGTVALAGDYGITFVKSDRITGTIGYDDGLANPKVLCLLEQPDGKLLAGTDGDGIVVIKDGEIVDVYRKENGLSSKVILRMTADKQGRGVYVVTSNSLCFMTYAGNIRVLENFPYYNNYDVIAGTDGELFVLSSAGIYVVNRDALLSGEELEYVLLDSQTGLRVPLVANSWNYKDENGCLYLAGESGVTVIDTKHYRIGAGNYRVNLDRIRLDDTYCRVRYGETVRISKSVSRVVISPEVINYSASDPYVSVYLEGFDAAPKICRLSQMTDSVYTNLRAGTYTFHVAVLDEGGNIDLENTYQIVKDANIYENNWFLIYVGAVFVITIVYLTWMLFRTQIQRTLDIQKRELELAQKQVAMNNEAILTIAKTVDAKDINTSEHSYRVSEYAEMIAERLGFSKADCEELRRTALLHDIGKIGIPDSVLNKPGRLTDEEYAIMKTHVTKGAEILKEFSSVAHIVEGAQYHHERYDGKGYAQGLAGEEIPLNARIIGIADAFDAMTANRVYRKKLDFGYVLEELKKGKGTQFDPKLVDILLGLIEDGKIQPEKLYE